MPAPWSRTAMRTPAALADAGADLEDALGRARSRPWLDRVAREVEDHLLEHHRVAARSAAGRASTSTLTRTPVRRACSSTSARQSSSSCPASSGTRCGSLLPHEFVHAPDHLPARAAPAARLGERRGELLHARVAALEQVEGAREVARDGAQRLVQLVGERRGHLAHGREPRGGLQPLVLLALALLGLLLLRHVEDGAHPARLAAVGVTQRRVVDHHRESARRRRAGTPSRRARRSPGPRAPRSTRCWYSSMRSGVQ